MSACVGRLSQVRLGPWTWPWFALVLTACVPLWSRTFPGLEPVSPSVQLSGFLQVDTLQPQLRWKPAKAQGVAYDLVVWDSGLDPEKAEPGARFNWGTIVYQRDGLAETVHRVDMPLKPKTLYFWSVRTREGSTLGDWSTFDGWVAVTGLVGTVRRDIRSAPFGFKTP